MRSFHGAYCSLHRHRSPRHIKLFSRRLGPNIYLKDIHGQTNGCASIRNLQSALSIPLFSHCDVRAKWKGNLHQQYQQYAPPQAPHSATDKSDNRHTRIASNTRLCEDSFDDRLQLRRGSAVCRFHRRRSPTTISASSFFAKMDREEGVWGGVGRKGRTSKYNILPGPNCGWTGPGMNIGDFPLTIPSCF